MLEVGAATVTSYSGPGQWTSQWLTDPSPSELGTPDGAPMSLSSSKVFALPSMTRVAVRNSGNEEARILVLSLSPPAMMPARTDTPAPNERPNAELDTCAPPALATSTTRRPAPESIALHDHESGQ